MAHVMSVALHRVPKVLANVGAVLLGLSAGVVILTICDEFAAQHHSVFWYPSSEPDYDMFRRSTVLNNIRADLFFLILAVTTLSVGSQITRAMAMVIGSALTIVAAAAFTEVAEAILTITASRGWTFAQGLGY